MCNCRQCDPKCVSCGKPLEPGEDTEHCDYCAFCVPMTPQEKAWSEKIAATEPDELPF